MGGWIHITLVMLVFLLSQRFVHTGITERLNPLQKIPTAVLKPAFTEITPGPSYSIEISSQIKSISDVLGQFIFEISKFGASSIATTAKTLQSLLMNHIGPIGGKFMVRWGFLLYSSASTTKMMYDMYLYESIFTTSGQLHQKLIDDFVIISDLINDNIEIIDFITNSGFVTIMEFEMSADRYEKNQARIHIILAKMKLKVEKISSDLELEKKEHSKNKRRSVFTGIGTGVWVAGSIAIATLYPPSIPWLVVSKASSILGLSLSGTNFCLAYLSEKNFQKVKYRITQFQEIGEMIEVVRNESLALYEDFTSYKNSMIVRLNKRSLVEKFVIQPLKFVSNISFLESVNAGLKWTINSFSLLLVISVVSVIFRRLFSYQPHDQQLSFRQIKYVAIVLSISFILSGCIDFSMSFARDKQNELEKQVVGFKIRQLRIQEQYNQECIWYEIPIHRQVELEVKAALWSVFGWDGSRELSRNSSGHLLNDARCDKMVRMLQMDPVTKLNYVKANVDTYMQLWGNLAKHFSRMFAAGIETFVQNTSVATKLWTGSIVTLWVYIFWARARR